MAKRRYYRKSPERRGTPWSVIAVVISLIGNIGMVVKLSVDMEHRFTVLESDVGYIKGALKIPSTRQ